MKIKENTGSKLSPRSRLKVLLVHSLIGASLFYFLIHPITMVIYWIEYNEDSATYSSILEGLFNRVGNSFSPEMIGMALAFIVLGSLIGVGSGVYYIRIKDKNKKIFRQEYQLKRDLVSVIQQGENDSVEFKSSLRYDLRKKSVNKDLELVILKTIAGFLNANGGRLIIGVSDNGKILGLDNDYNSLKKKDKDCFEQRLFQLVSGSIGSEFCPFIQVFFFQMEGKDICVAEIEKSIFPAYVSHNNNTTFYLRIGNSTKPLSVKETVNYLNMGQSLPVS